jgi:hypothetical protein
MGRNIPGIKLPQKAITCNLRCRCIASSARNTAME